MQGEEEMDKWNEFLFAPKWLNSVLDQNNPEVHFLDREGSRVFIHAGWCFFNHVQKVDSPPPSVGSTKAWMEGGTSKQAPLVTLQPSKFIQQQLET